MNETIQLLHTRRSVKVKDMIEPAPSEQELEDILKAGLRVPDHGKCFPWRIRVMDKAQQAELGEVLATRFAELNPDANEKQITFERIRPSRAPLLLCVTSAYNLEKSHIPHAEQLLSAGALCQNILIATHALGYVGQWLTEWPAYDAAVKQHLGVDSQNSVVGFLYIGSVDTPPMDRARPEIDKIVQY